MKSALIAMSGGVDSSVAAYLTLQQGLDCIGTMMKLFQGDEEEVRQNSCCSLSDASDARAVSQRLGMPFYVFNFKDTFNEEVIDRFVQAYARGQTPNPCIDCNRYLKFERLYHRARELGREYVVTGHYARIAYDSGRERYLLKKGLDEGKDQSYVLYAMTQQQLSATLFPLGELHKSQVREIAREQGFINAQKHDSQDICFVQKGTYADFIEEYTGRSFPEGPFVDTSGNILGTHKGIIHYTVGQRKGLGISSEKPLYVVKIIPEENKVVLGDGEALFTKKLLAEDINLIAYERLTGPIRVKARVRYKQEEQPATVTQIGEDKLQIVFDEPQRAVTCGQAVVLYDGDVVVGGGTISDTF